MRALPIGAQISARTLADELKDMSGHLAKAGNFGAATAHRLSGIAHAKVLEIDDAAPLGQESIESLKGVAALTKLANDSSQIAINLLAANKEKIREINSGEATEPGQLLAELVAHLPD